MEVNIKEIERRVRAEQALRAIMRYAANGSFGAWRQELYDMPKDGLSE